MIESEYQGRIWEISTIIKLVAGENIPAITKVASNLKNRFDPEQIDNMDNNIIYECYCKMCVDVE